MKTITARNVNGAILRGVDLFNDKVNKGPPEAVK